MSEQKISVYHVSLEPLKDDSSIHIRFYCYLAPEQAAIAALAYARRLGKEVSGINVKRYSGFPIETDGQKIEAFKSKATVGVNLLLAQTMLGFDVSYPESDEFWPTEEIDKINTGSQALPTQQSESVRL